MNGSRRLESRGVRQLRLVVEVADYDAALTFFRDVLGLPEEAAFSGTGDRSSCGLLRSTIRSLAS